MIKKVKVRTSLIALLLLIVSVLAYFGGRLFILSRLEKTIITQLTALGLEGVIVRYNSLETNPWKKSLVMKGLEVKFNDKDSLCFTGATIPTVELNGIALLPLLFNHELDLDAIFLDRPAVRAMNYFKMHRRKKGKENFLKGISIALLRIDSGTVELIDSTSCKSVAHVHLDLDSRGLSAHLVNDESPIWTVGEVTISGVKADFPAHFYKLTVKQAFYSGVEKLFKVDSLQISPLYNKEEFARRAGQQIDQFSCAVPVILATGFQVDQSPLSYAAHHVDLRFRLEVFRDKRIARAIRKPTVLPVNFLHQQPFRLQIDSLTISDSYVSYEEFPEMADTSGKVFFNGLHAGISNISNSSPKEATMDIHARFMNSGDLKVNFTFPFEEQKPCTVRGSLSHFSMPEINSMLMSHVHAEVESGEIQEMKFHFQYNEYRSDGEVELSYTNLKVRRFRKNQEKSENKLISFVLNMFVKNDLDKSDTKERRTGSIEMDRNSQRGIFNYWWKSVFSGVKSVFHRGGKKVPLPVTR